jgi:hypothetical protein
LTNKEQSMKERPGRLAGCPLSVLNIPLQFRLSPEDSWDAISSVDS